MVASCSWKSSPPRTSVWRRYRSKRDYPVAVPRKCRNAYHSDVAVVPARPWVTRAVARRNRCRRNTGGGRGGRGTGGRGRGGPQKMDVQQPKKQTAAKKKAKKPRKPKAKAAPKQPLTAEALNARSRRIKLKLWSRNYFYLLTSTCSIYFEIKLFIIYSVIHVYLASM